MDPYPLHGSIYEFLWYQRGEYPNLPIPIILVKFVEKIKELNGLNSIGIFRLPGSLRKVEMIIADNVFSDQMLASCSCNDLASLFKRWLRDLSITLIPDFLLHDFKGHCETYKYTEFLPKLSKAHFFTLGYLVGFLKEVYSYAAVTKMDTKALGTVFAPNIAAVRENDPGSLTRINALSSEFIGWMILNFDCGAFYPLNESYFQ